MDYASWLELARRERKKERIALKIAEETKVPLSLVLEDLGLSLSKEKLLYPVSAYEKYLKTLEEKPISLGFPKLEKGLGFIIKPFYLIIGGRPRVGKTTFSINICLNLLPKFKILFFTLEMPSSKIFERALSIYSGYSIKELREFYKLGSPLFEEKAKELLKLLDNLLFVEFLESIDDVPYLIEAAREELEGLDICILDHLQLIPKILDYSEMSRTSKKIQRICKEENVIFIVNSHFSKAFENKEPNLRSLRFAGEDEADAVIGLWLEGEEDEDEESIEEKEYIHVGMKILKARYGIGGVKSGVRISTKNLKMEEEWI